MDGVRDQGGASAGECHCGVLARRASEFGISFRVNRIRQLQVSLTMRYETCTRGVYPPEGNRDDVSEAEGLALRFAAQWSVIRSMCSHRDAGGSAFDCVARRSSDVNSIIVRLLEVSSILPGATITACFIASIPLGNGIQPAAIDIVCGADAVAGARGAEENKEIS
jgi:hypothetical protein